MLLKAKWTSVGVKMDNKKFQQYSPTTQSFISVQIVICLEWIIWSQLAIQPHISNIVS